MVREKKVIRSYMRNIISISSVPKYKALHSITKHRNNVISQLIENPKLDYFGPITIGLPPLAPFINFKPLY